MPYSYDRKKRLPAMSQTMDKQASTKSTHGQTENFFTAHVRALTFLFCMISFFALCGPWNIFRIGTWVEEQRQESAKMPIEDLMRIATLGTDMAWNDFENYTSHTVSEDVCYIRRYEIRGGEYILFVGADVPDGPIRTAILVRLSDAVRVDLLTEDNDFIFEH